MSVYRFQRDSELVAPLERFGKKDVALAGGKGANLGELIRAGFDIPPGFVITTAAYDLLLQQTDLQTRMLTAIARFQPEDLESAKQVSQQIQGFWEQVSIPEKVVNEILQAFGQLNKTGVAVRSSATAEDLPEAAFAGQQETFLNVIGETELLKAVRACWKSLSALASSLRSMYTRARAFHAGA